MFLIGSGLRDCMASSQMCIKECEVSGVTTSFQVCFRVKSPASPEKNIFFITMKSFVFCFIMLLMAMAATTTLAGPVGIEQLKNSPQYEGPGKVSFEADVDTAEKDKDVAEVTNEDKRVKRSNNEFDGYLAFRCPCHQSISTISSYHSNPHEDRRFSISCKPLFLAATSCHQSHWVNNFDARFDFTCGKNEALTGIYSYHSNLHEDRRFMFHCCSADLILNGCRWTQYLNNFDQPFTYQVPNNMVIAGVSSYHHSFYEDRRYRLYVCEMEEGFAP
ncbi:hemagglutinin/amebocyte aggregation factor-like [Engraulis encrasicolus]|uniref:hemagglutinin/amebocyte aggregation factor-like n=1 Tax=Engraulis encrasicolus TaxID=184585 RepID=UPI002FD62273